MLGTPASLSSSPFLLASTTTSTAPTSQPSTNRFSVSQHHILQGLLVSSHADYLHVCCQLLISGYRSCANHTRRHALLVCQARYQTVGSQLNLFDARFAAGKDEMSAPAAMIGANEVAVAFPHIPPPPQEDAVIPVADCEERTVKHFSLFFSSHSSNWSSFTLMQPPGPVGC